MCKSSPTFSCWSYRSIAPVGWWHLIGLLDLGHKGALRVREAGVACCVFWRGTLVARVCLLWDILFKQSHKLKGWEAQSPPVMASVIPPSISWSTDPCTFPGGTQFHINTPESWRMVLYPCQVLSLSWHFRCTFSRQFYSSVIASCILSGTVCNTASGFHDYEAHSPTSCAVKWSILVRCCVICDQAFCKPLYGGGGWGSAGEDKPVSGIIIYFCENELLDFPGWMGPKWSQLLSIFLKEKHHIGDSALISGASRLGNWDGDNRFLLGPCTTSISATRATPFFPLCQFCGGWLQRLDDINSSDYFVYWIIQCLVHGGCFLVDVKYQLPYVHLQARISNQAHPSTRVSRNIFQLTCSENRNQEIFGE